MKLALLFGILCAVFFGLYATFFASVLYYPETALILAIPMVITVWGSGIFFILAIVMFALKR